MCSLVDSILISSGLSSRGGLYAMLFPGPDGRLGINFFREPGRAFWNSHGLSRVADRKLRTTTPSSDERSRSQVVWTSVVDNIPLRGFLRSPPGQLQRGISKCRHAGHPLIGQRSMPNATSYLELERPLGSSLALYKLQRAVGGVVLLLIGLFSRSTSCKSDSWQN